MVKTDKTIIAILDKIEGMERQKENFSTTIFGTFQQRMLFFQQQKIVSIVSIVFKITQESRLWSSPLPPAILVAKVLKTIETIETILKKQYFFILALSFQKQRCLLRQLEHALDRLDGVACDVGRHIDGGPLVEKRVIHLLKGVHLHKLTLVA